MKTYHKIQTVFYRDPENNNKTLLEGQWSLPEFEFLQNLKWIWTEKIDGTNIRIIWDGFKVEIKGKTDDAQIPPFLLKVLEEKFTVEKMKKQFPDDAQVCLYGEGYGAKIQKGGNYLSDRTDFFLFDCKIDNWWLLRNSIEDIAKKLSINIVPIIGTGTLMKAIDYCRAGFVSTIACNKNYIAEGLIMKPEIELFSRKGERIITKIKFKDFKKEQKNK